MLESFVHKVDFARRKGRAAAQSFIMETCLAVCGEICYNINEYPQIRGNNGVSMVMSNPIVTIEMEQGGIIRAELYPEVAPNTVRNFISLIQKGFYDGTIFHRVIPVSYTHLLFRRGPAAGRVHRRGRHNAGYDRLRRRRAADRAVLLALPPSSSFIRSFVPSAGAAFFASSP